MKPPFGKEFVLGTIKVDLYLLRRNGSRLALMWTNVILHGFFSPSNGSRARFE
uniref:Uncharacterized protein n=1 Tax=Medicago truncatula TaxID=3880 RepID=A2Q3R9_MEDTR|nr:hypothetical protein MtrDRAFT_AC155888g16v2 [Medicago truncatula]